MPPPMSALITAKDNNDDLVEVVLFEKFNDLRGFGRRLFLPFDVSFLEQFHFILNNGTVADSPDLILTYSNASIRFGLSIIVLEKVQNDFYLYLIQQLVQYGTTTLNIEVVLGRQSPSFSLKLLRRMISIAKKADERMRQVI